jgi:hypothetical protein
MAKAAFTAAAIVLVGFFSSSFVPASMWVKRAYASFSSDPVPSEDCRPLWSVNVSPSHNALSMSQPGVTPDSKNRSSKMV